MSDYRFPGVTPFVRAAASKQAKDLDEGWLADQAQSLRPVRAISDHCTNASEALQKGKKALALEMVGHTQRELAILETGMAAVKAMLDEIGQHAKPEPKAQPKPKPVPPPSHNKSKDNS